MAYQYPEIKFERSESVVDGVRVVKVLLFTHVLNTEDEFVSVELTGYYPIEEGKDVDVETAIGEQFHERCMDVYYGDRDRQDDVVGEDDERFI